MPDMFSFRFEPGIGLERKIDKAVREAQNFIDTECLHHCQPLVPKRENILIDSGIISTGGGEIKYRTPYARRWYYMPADFNEGEGSGMGTVGRGNYWFERMKQQHCEQIRKGAQIVLNQNL